MRLFAWFTGNYLVDYYPVFIVLPLALTAFLGLGFSRIDELTILDAKVLYTPATAPCEFSFWVEEFIDGLLGWNEEKVLSKVSR
jgi:hypothetical protein